MHNSPDPSQPQGNFTFFMLKPDAIRRNLIGQILTQIELKRFHLIEMKMLMPTLTLVEKHYQEHQEKSYFKDLCKSIASNYPIVIGTLAYTPVPDLTVKMFRSFVGPYSNPSSDTLRGMFAENERNNAVHSSANNDDAIRERDLWSL